MSFLDLQGHDDPGAMVARLAVLGPHNEASGRSSSAGPGALAAAPTAAGRAVGAIGDGLGGPRPVGFEAHPGADDCAVSPAMAHNSTAFVKALGPAAGVEACAAACWAWVNASDPAAACQSFTFYNASAPPPLRGRCFAHVTAVWIPRVSVYATSGRMRTPCRDALSCSLNGERRQP